MNEQDAYDLYRTQNPSFDPDAEGDERLMRDLLDDFTRERDNERRYNESFPLWRFFLTSILVTIGTAFLLWGGAALLAMLAH